MKKSFKLSTFLMVLFLLIFFSFTLGDEKTDKVNKLFAKWDKADSPGCALAVIKDGKIIYKKGYGMANLEHNIPITSKSVFYIGSVSKQFVSMSIALLAKEGKLSLDDDIRKYLPEMPDYGTPITIRHLIHHTSGLRDYLTLLGIAGIDFGTYHEDEAVELIARQKELNFKPGEEYLYSNSGYLTLAVIVERASGKSLRNYADENIFTPLGMTSSHFHDDYTMLIKNRATGYFPGGKGKYKNFISTFDCVGSGGLFTNVEDLFQWDQNFIHKKVGGQDVFDLIHTKGKLNNGKELDYAFALTIGTYKGLKTVGHGGALGGYRSSFLRFPEQNFSIICLSNLSSFNPSRLSRQVADIYLADQFKEGTKPKAKPPEEGKFIELSEEKLKEKVGGYIQPKTGDIMRLFIREDKLCARMFGRVFSLAAVSETEFQLLKAPVDIILKFEKQAKGKPLLVYLYQEEEEPKTYESFKLPKPTLDQLKKYIGDYYSEELQVTFNLRLKKDKLNFVQRNAPRNPLVMVLEDRFNISGMKIHFVRDEENKIIAFTLDAGRVKNLRFDKKQTD
ncbi:MAG: serine hydrolase [Candidatus Aminicenantes bacterium]|nr:MAG: serine hydrolase [Candidatus Aminicenantes bacterium]